MCDSSSASASPASSASSSSRGKGLRLPQTFLDIAGKFSVAATGEPVDENKPRGGEEPHVTCILMLLACQYEESDILTVLSMALANIHRQADEFAQMGEREKAFVAAIHIYLAHIFIFDECVPLRYWHDWAFSGYCSFGCLNRALGKLLKLMRYRITVTPEIVEHNKAFLRGGEGAPTTARASPLTGKW